MLFNLHDKITARGVLYAVILAAAGFLLVDTYVDSRLAGPDFLGVLFSPTAEEVWDRSLVIVILIGLGLYTRTIVGRLRGMQAELERLVDEKTAELRRTNEERTLVTHRLIEIHEKERKRIAVELHDMVGQILTGISLKCKEMESRTAAGRQIGREEMTSVLANINEVIKSIRLLSAGLSPLHVKKYGLVWSIERLAEDCPAMFGIPCRVEASYDPEISDGVKAEQLYLIVQEAVFNAARHSGTPEVRIDVSGKGNGVSLVVRDFGTGLLPDAGKREGMGMNIMRYRAEMIGAELDVRANESGGSDVVCELGHD